MISAKCDHTLTLNGKLCAVRVEGKCTRNLLGAIQCEVTSVRSADGIELLGVVPNDALEPMARQLWCSHLAGAHRLGDEVADIGA